jgi:outer membrane lipoprotein-sorting protein
MKHAIRLVILIIFATSVTYSQTSSVTNSKTDTSETTDIFKIHPDTGVSVTSVVDHVDKLYRSDTSAGEMDMIITTPDWKRTLSMFVWTEGITKTLLNITYPNKDKGITTLRIDKEMWNYFPKIDRVMKVPPSMMMGSWMGSDFTNDDLVKESSLKQDYDSWFFIPEDPNPEYYYIRLIPKAEAISVWSKIELVVWRKDYIPIEQSYFDEDGKIMRKMEFSEVKTFGNKKIPSVLTMIPFSEFRKGHSTQIVYKTIKFNAALSPDVFSLRSLQKKR